MLGDLKIRMRAESRDVTGAQGSDCNLALAKRGDQRERRLCAFHYLIKKRGGGRTDQRSHHHRRNIRARVFAEHDHQFFFEGV